MLNTSSTLLTGSETFEEAFALIPQKETQVRYLQTSDGQDTGVYQLYSSENQRWSSPRMVKTRSDGSIIPIDTNTKHKLANASLFYDIFTTPTHAGADDSKSWLIGDIDHCTIQNEDYNIQGLIISSIFDPTPKYYISFERLVCENQMGTLGTSNSSMYIDMNKFLVPTYTSELKDQLSDYITAEVEKRLAMSEEVTKKLLNIKLSDNRVEEMFKKLTVDTVAKASEAHKEQERRLANYLSAYNCDDNQNFKGTFFGFVNSCTNIRTREKTNPLDVVKPVISPAIINTPCNLEYLYRDVLVHAA